MRFTSFGFAQKEKLSKYNIMADSKVPQNKILQMIKLFANRRNNG